jgi:hypothetical protein
MFTVLMFRLFEKEERWVRFEYYCWLYYHYRSIWIVTGTTSTIFKPKRIDYMLWYRYVGNHLELIALWPLMNQWSEFFHEAIGLNLMLPFILFKEKDFCLKNCHLRYCLQLHAYHNQLHDSYPCILSILCDLSELPLSLTLSRSCYNPTAASDPI